MDGKGAARWRHLCPRPDARQCRRVVSGFPQALQARLKEQQIYTGATDGDFGAGTQDAIDKIFNVPL